MSCPIKFWVPLEDWTWFTRFYLSTSILGLFYDSTILWRREPLFIWNMNHHTRNPIHNRFLKLVCVKKKHMVLSVLNHCFYFLFYFLKFAVLSDKESTNVKSKLANHVLDPNEIQNLKGTRHSLLRRKQTRKNEK